VKRQRKKQKHKFTPKQRGLVGLIKQNPSSRCYRTADGYLNNKTYRELEVIASRMLGISQGEAKHIEDGLRQKKPDAEALYDPEWFCYIPQRWSDYEPQYATEEEFHELLRSLTPEQRERLEEWNAACEAERLADVERHGPMQEPTWRPGRVESWSEWIL
jgi:hypothetical protein